MKNKKFIRSQMRAAALLWRKTGVRFHLRAAKAYRDLTK